MSGSDTAARKRDLRRRLRAARRALPATVQRRHGLEFAAQVLRQSWFRRCDRVALYWPDDGELDVRPLMRLCWQLGKQVYLPRLRRGGRMEFAEYRRGDVLRRSAYGLLQPSPGTPAVATERLDIVFAPLVAFTADGRRLGRGGGYYDRLFATRQGRRAVLVGVAHDLQRVESIEVDDWDVGLCGAITETGATGPPFGIARKLTRKSLPLP